MGWPSDNPLGWEEVEREAVRTWMHREQTGFSYEWLMRAEQREMLLLWLEAEYPGIFRAMVEAAGEDILLAEAAYLER